MSQELAILTRSTIERVVRKAPVQVDAVLGHAHLLMSDLLRLQPGDVLQLDSLADAPIVVEVDKAPKFFATAGRKRDASAVRVTELIQE
jgi:flagellar motor switch protein FliM